LQKRQSNSDEEEEGDLTSGPRGTPINPAPGEPTRYGNKEMKELSLELWGQATVIRYLKFSWQNLVEKANAKKTELAQLQT
jgi:hypothetical protein